MQNAIHLQDGETVTIDAPEAFEITANRNQVPETKEIFDLEAYGGSAISRILHDSSESVSGNLAAMSYRMMDYFHTCDGSFEDYNNWTFTVIDRDSNAPDEFSAMVNEMKGRAKDALEAHFAQMAEMYGMEAPDGLSEMKLPANEMVDYAVERKLAYETFRGAWVETYTQEALENHFNSEVVITDAEITAETGVEDPDGKGIDAYVVDEDLTVQIKEGDGGGTEDGSDALARYYLEDEGRGNPVVKLTNN